MHSVVKEVSDDVMYTKLECAGETLVSTTFMCDVMSEGMGVKYQSLCRL